MTTVTARPPAKKVILRESGACRHDCPYGAACCCRGDMPHELHICNHTECACHKRARYEKKT